jgi:hypothetical protein
MSVIVTVSGIEFTIPETGERAVEGASNWGDDTTEWIVTISDAMSGLVGPGDIALKTNINLVNNQAVAANVFGMKFENTVTRSAVLECSIYRVTSLEELSEITTLYVTYYSNSNTWAISNAGAGTSGINFTITPAGQVQYTSTNMSGTGYSGKLAFRARSYRP